MSTEVAQTLPLPASERGRWPGAGPCSRCYSSQPPACVPVSGMAVWLTRDMSLGLTWPTSLAGEGPSAAWAERLLGHPLGSSPLP